MIRPKSRAARCRCRLVECCFLAVATMACGKKTQEPPNVTPAPAQNITGTERFGWAQAAADSHELSTFRYAAYVDGTRVELTGVSCKPPSSPAATDFECSAPLPPMSAGTHALELVVFIVDGGG